ncbi:MAG: mitotic cohesin complex non-SMC subunit Rad21, partial [Amphiamblys sp. WSBS2006]
MFFVDNVLTKKGPFATIWMAANWEKKLTKTTVAQTDIPLAVSNILDGTVPRLALRLSGQLLLGISRVYRRKVLYLHEDYTHLSASVRMLLLSAADPLKHRTAAPKKNEKAFLDELDTPMAVPDFDDAEDSPQRLSEEIELARRLSLSDLSAHETDPTSSLLNSPVLRKRTAESACIPAPAKTKPFLCDEITQVPKTFFDSLEVKKTKNILFPIEHLADVTNRNTRTRVDEIEQAREALVEENELDFGLDCLEEDIASSAEAASEASETAPRGIEYGRVLEDYAAKNKTFCFGSLPGARSKDRARLFFEILSLATKGVLRPEQKTPHGDIVFFCRQRLSPCLQPSLRFAT